MHSLQDGSRNYLTVSAFAALIAVLWLLHGYEGLAGDAQLYALQALARIHPALAVDLYLQNTSQDQYSVFAPIFAWCINQLGLAWAGLALTMVFSAWLLIATGSLASALVGRDKSWLSVAILVIAATDYGASGVFHFSETCLTARLPAEALVVTALACHIRNFRILGFVFAAAALFVHPLMAFPGLLTLVIMSVPIRLAIFGTIAGLGLTLIMASIAATTGTHHVIVKMDASWIEVVRERSQFLFLQLWSAHDWEVNAKPLLYLALIASVLDDKRIRAVCIAAGIIGCAGLLIGLIASAIGPVAILLQGQAWRWIWIAGVISASFLPAAALRIWDDKQYGMPCIVLLASGWTGSFLGSSACLALVIILWRSRDRLTVNATMRWRLVSCAVGIATLTWVIANSWTPAVKIAYSANDGVAAPPFGNIVGAKLLVAFFFVVLWLWIRKAETLWKSEVILCASAFFAAMMMPSLLRTLLLIPSESDQTEYADWLAAIPPRSTVLVTPNRDAGAFVWLVLQRPNYLALDQSAGVVFSRATALEVGRRSEVLASLKEPDWKIFSAHQRSSVKGKGAPSSQRLTPEILDHICGDPLLDFVVSPQNLEFHSIRHVRADAMQNWNLYDCAGVRSRSISLRN